MSLAPVREAAGSMAKASTPEPFSASRTSNWVARGGGLPAYVQHVAHDLVEAGHPESQAIQIAIGVIKRWAKGVPSGGEKHVDPTTVAAAQKALAEWEALKAKAHAKSAAKSVAESLSVAEELVAARVLRDAALTRVAILSEQFGGQRGLAALLEADAKIQEAGVEGFSPTLKRVPSARGELERFELHHEGQHVGTISRRRVEAIGGRSGGDRFRAHAINGDAIAGEYDNPLKSKDEAIKAVQTHLEEAPARVVSLPAEGKYLVARPSAYGQTTYTGFSNEQAARNAAGLPPSPTLPERSSQVEKLGEMLRMDLTTLAGIDIPPLRRVQEACRRVPFA